ncbi:MAG: CDP-alcohol phosphatidyltransferase family protein [Armatimonadetes bacterium]|nr:CDP-alcohol phosphatidyltransferase family protein [Armatimonadota bacterium]
MLGAVVCTGPPSGWEGDREAWERLRVGGMHPTARNARLAAQVGAEPVLLWEAGPGSPDSPAAPWEIPFRTAAGGRPDRNQWLVVPPGVVLDESAVRQFLAAPVPPAPAEAAPSPQAIADAQIWLIARTGGAGTPGQLSACLPGAEDAHRLLRPADAAAAELRLLAGCTSETDGWLDRMLHRSLSRPITRFLLRGPITPDQITLGHVSLGLIAACLLAFPGVLPGLAGCFLLQASVVLDCVDGELARLRLLYSRWGGLLDTLGDNLVHGALFVGIGAGVREKLGEELALALVGSTATGILLAALTVWALTEWQRRRWQAGRPAGFALAPVAANLALLGEEAPPLPAAQRRFDAWINQLTSRDYSVLVWLLVLLDRREWLLWLAAIGSHLFWIGFLLLQAGIVLRSEAASRGTVEREPHPP